MTTKPNDSRPALERFLTRCMGELGFGRCWSPDSSVPACVCFDGTNVSGVRAVYALCVGDIPDKFMVRNTCPTKGCLNPRHLTLVYRSDVVGFSISERLDLSKWDKLPEKNWGSSDSTRLPYEWRTFHRTWIEEELDGLATRDSTNKGLGGRRRRDRQGGRVPEHDTRGQDPN